MDPTAPNYISNAIGDTYSTIEQIVLSIMLKQMVIIHREVHMFMFLK
jgi:hypothetical protein